MKGLFIVFTLISTAIHSQALEEIRSHYGRIDQLIKACDADPDQCGLYKNELTINSGGQQWRGVGNYKKIVEFWYTDDPTNCDECSDDGLSVLVKVIVSESGATYTSLTEYLYKDGKMIFCYRKSEDETGLEEKRFYFEQGTLIRYQLNASVLDPSQSDAGVNRYIHDQAKKYQEVFLRSF